MSIRTLFSRGTIAAALISIAACSSGSGGGGGPNTADVQFAQDLSGVWELTLTVTSTDCPTRVVGETDTVALLFESSTDSADLSLRDIDEEFADDGTGQLVSQGKTLSTDGPLSAAVRGGLLTANRTRSDETVTLEFGQFTQNNLGRNSFGTGTARVVETGTTSCTTVFSVIGRRDTSVDSTQERAGAWRFTLDQVIGSIPGVTATVGQTGTFVLRPDASFSDRFTGALVNGPVLGSFAQVAIPENATATNPTTRGIGEGTIVDAPNPLSFQIRFDNGGSLTSTAVQINVDDGNGNTLILSGLRTQLDACIPVPGSWTFEFANTTIIGTMEQTGCSLFLGNSAAAFFGTVNATGDFEGVLQRQSLPSAVATGSFNAAVDSFTGTSSIGTITGTQTAGGSGNGGGSGSCPAISTGTWDISGDSGGVSLPNGTMTQDGCDVTFTFDLIPQLETTISGPLNGTQWTPTVTGALGGILTNIDVTFSGDPATGFSGTASNGGLLIDFQGGRQ